MLFRIVFRFSIIVFIIVYILMAPKHMSNHINVLKSKESSKIDKFYSGGMMIVFWYIYVISAIGFTKFVVIDTLNWLIDLIIFW